MRRYSVILKSTSNAVQYDADRIAHLSDTVQQPDYIFKLKGEIIGVVPRTEVLYITSMELEPEPTAEDEGDSQTDTG